MGNKIPLEEETLEGGMNLALATRQRGLEKVGGAGCAEELKQGLNGWDA
jgi:hypothetical protein